ncbi:hypothetical protein DVT68_03410 [Dyella solisilvae]|uniref:2'-5' RNA ligase family protein n=1 Tax=Dyella solisilvae TaxID=1920168 RepID=A0A370KBD2_9GAMM|nr:2'-5' RNA ligase family protein [Dyella solisilvae]RDI99889.1 hypothetical protein DVT68_03410 [Dyella solisilvae]
MLFSDPNGCPAKTQVAELRDYPEWHRGRERYGVWIVPVEQPELLGYIDEARRALDDLLHPCPLRQPHLTVFVCGFARDTATEDDDFSPAQLRRQIAMLSGDLGAALALPLSAPDSFTTAAFIPVHDPEGRLARWRSRLGGAANEVRQSTYVPHITLGLYRKEVTAAVLRSRLAGIDPPVMALQAHSLNYATYETRSQFGPLHSHHRLALPGGISTPA